MFSVVSSYFSFYINKDLLYLSHDYSLNSNTKVYKYSENKNITLFSMSDSENKRENIESINRVENQAVQINNRAIDSQINVTSNNNELNNTGIGHGQRDNHNSNHVISNETSSSQVIGRGHGRNPLSINQTSQPNNLDYVRNSLGHGRIINLLNIDRQPNQFSIRHGQSILSNHNGFDNANGQTPELGINRYPSYSNINRNGFGRITESNNINLNEAPIQERGRPRGKNR